jgi:hypothetical protein
MMNENLVLQNHLKEIRTEKKAFPVRPCENGRRFQKYNQLHRNIAVLSDSKARLDSVCCS